MLEIFYIVCLSILIIILNYLFKKKDFLLSFTGEKHQIFAAKEKIPLIGGILVVVSFILFFHNFSFLLTIFLLIFFLLGVLSDTKPHFSPTLRFILQSIIIFIYVFLDDLRIVNTGIIFLDNLLAFNIFNYFFVCFCLLILINGTNFIDGLNTNVVGYYLILSIFLYDVNFLNILNLEHSYWIF